MAGVIKRLGATTVTANTNTELYTVPTGKSAVNSTILVHNQGTTDRTFQIAHLDNVSGVVTSPAAEDFIRNDNDVLAKEALGVSYGITMGENDTIMVRANHADVTFIMWGEEID